MTTQVHIVNSSDSNPGQHARVTFKRRGYEHPEVTALAPGESKAFWIGGDANGVGDEITVVEVFAPKPQPKNHTLEADPVQFNTTHDGPAEAEQITLKPGAGPAATA